MWHTAGATPTCKDEKDEKDEQKCRKVCRVQKGFGFGHPGWIRKIDDRLIKSRNPVAFGASEMELI